MKITREEVLHVASLARLTLGEDAVDRLAGQIGKILEYIDTLNRVDTEGVEPTAHALSLTNAFREDERTPSLERSEALANAPEQDQGCFVVPKVIE